MGIELKADFKDQLHRTVSVPFPPKRIISTVPSITELLADLHLSEKLVGITKFCVNPSDIFKTKEKIGGTKNLNLDKIKSLNPDLIISNKEENLKTEIDSLSQEFPVWVSDVNSLEDALEMIDSLGNLTDTVSIANRIKKLIIEEFENLYNHIKAINYQPLSVVYLIWNDPFMVAGDDTFISDMLDRCNLKNCISLDRYPEIAIKELQELNPDVVFLSSEPFPFKNKHVNFFKEHLKNSKVMIVDGEMFSWYGSHMIKSPSYFKSLINQLHL